MSDKGPQTGFTGLPRKKYVWGLEGPAAGFYTPPGGIYPAMTERT
jgi:hypothetical protein